METIGVFFGGKNPEHDVSIITAQLIISGLKGLDYPVIPVYLDKEGGWHIDEKLGSIEFFKRKNHNLGSSNRFYLDLEKSKEKLVFRKKNWPPKEIIIDLVFPAFHGQNGEDGMIQGFFEIFNIPYVGCDVASSAIAMDKILTKLIYQRQGIPTTEFIYFYKQDWEKKEIRAEILKDIKNHLRFPLFVKPARLGSSIGITKVKTQNDLVFAIEVALHYDEKVLIEEGVENLIDVTCAVLGNNEPIASLLQESVFGDSFFSYEEKYLKKGGAQLGKAQDNIIIPARLDQKTTKEIKSLAIKVFSIFDCSGIARVDFLYNKKSKKVYANEINTLPGTLYHHLWKKSGWEFDQLLSELIKLAKEKHQAKEKLTRVFTSNILELTGGSKLNGI